MLTEEDTAAVAMALTDEFDVVQGVHDACLQEVTDLLNAVDDATKLEMEMDEAEYLRCDADRKARAAAYRDQEQAEQERTNQQIMDLIYAEKERTAKAKAEMERIEAMHAESERKYTEGVIEREAKFETARMNAEKLQRTVEAIGMMCQAAKERAEKFAKYYQVE